PQPIELEEIEVDRRVVELDGTSIFALERPVRDVSVRRRRERAGYAAHARQRGKRLPECIAAGKIRLDEQHLVLVDAQRITQGERRLPMNDGRRENQADEYRELHDHEPMPGPP